MSGRILVVAAIVVAVLAGGVAAAQSGRFSDVPSDHRHAAAIEWAADTGLTAGYSDGTFRPETPLSKQHAAIFMERFYDAVLEADKSPDFTRGDMIALLHTIATASDVAPSGAPVGVSDPSACRVLRQGHRYTYPGAAPQQVDVTVVTVAFDDLPAPDDTYSASLHSDVEQNFIDELLAALEAKLEALSHGRTDWVFRRDSEVRLSGSAHSRSVSASLGRRTLAGMTDELSVLFPGEHLLAFTTISHEFPYTSFYADGVAVATVEAIDRDRDFFEPDLGAYQLSYGRFGRTLSDAAHEVLHLVGLDDTYQVQHDDGRGPSDTDSGQDSIMGLSSYGWGLGQIRSGGLLWARPWASNPGGEFFNGVMNLDEPSREYPHEPMAGWNKWLLGWLDDSEATCVPPDTTTEVVLRPHQQTTIAEVQRWSEAQYRWLRPDEPGGDCWRLGRSNSDALDQWVLDVLTKPSGGREVYRLLPGGWWGPPTEDPSIVIIATSDTTAVVIEADPFATAGPPGIPQCFIGELPGNRSTRFVGDILVYDVDITAPDRPLLMANPTVAIVTPLRFLAEAERFSATGPIGQAFGGLPVDSYFVSEVTVHGYRIAVEHATATDGTYEVTVNIEPPK